MQGKEDAQCKARQMSNARQIKSDAQCKARQMRNERQCKCAKLGKAYV
jgi:hypothetical protein